MEYVPKMTSPTPTGHQVHPDFKEQLEGWNSSGRPPKGFYSYKLAFGAEILRQSPPTVIGNAERERDRSDFRALLESERPREAHALKRRAFNFRNLDNGRFEPVLWSDDGALWVLDGSLGGEDNVAWRHGDCHELLFVHQTSEPFRILTDFGAIEDIQGGDFVHLPRGTTYAFPDQVEATVLAYEVPEPIKRPYDYWMGDQQLWPYPPDAPEGAKPKAGNASDSDYTEVIVKRRLGDFTTLSYDTPLFDSVAWEGEVWPFKLNVEKMNPIASPDFHVDPPKMTCFVSESEGVYVQAFLPRWMQSPPYNHMNSVDEALFNHSGYEARPEIGDGCLTFHPSGVPHGPDPRVAEELANEGHVDNPEEEIPWAGEIGIMVESATPFSVLGAGEDVELDGYNESWHDIAEDEGLV